MKFQIRLGMMARPLKDQLKGMRVPRSDLARFQALDEAVSHLYICGLLTDRQMESARYKLVKKIVAAIPKPKGKTVEAPCG